MDGFNITPWLVPSGIDDIVNDLIPELQNRGLYRTEYPGSTARENFGVADVSPVLPALAVAD